jgi:hypothetical protein
MFIGTAQRIATVTNELNINLENQFIKNVNTKKLLGIYIDNNCIQVPVNITFYNIFSSGKSFMNKIKSKGFKIDP